MIPTIAASANPSGKVATDAFERNIILKTLENNDWHQGKTAETLGIHRKTLEYKIKKLNIEKLVDERQSNSRR